MLEAIATAVNGLALSIAVRGCPAARTSACSAPPFPPGARLPAATAHEGVALQCSGMLVASRSGEVLRCVCAARLVHLPEAFPETASIFFFLSVSFVSRLDFPQLLLLPSCVLEVIEATLSLEPLSETDSMGVFFISIRLAV